MSTMKPHVTSFDPQFLVDDVERSIAYYQKIGLTFGEPWVMVEPSYLRKPEAEETCCADLLMTWIVK